MTALIVRFAAAYAAFLSAAAVCVTVYDKAAAKRGRFRVPEARLLLLAALGGSAAMFLTMLLIRHKTRRFKFMAGLPAILAAQILLLCGLAAHLPHGTFERIRIW